MEKIFKEEVVRVSSGTKFSWKDPYSDWSAELTVDENGKPIHASYGSMKGWCSKSPDDIGFDGVVHEVMTDLFRNDLEEFRKMRDSLNSEYRQMAESIRKDAISKYDF